MKPRFTGPVGHPQPNPDTGTSGIPPVNYIREEGFFRWLTSGEISYYYAHGYTVDPAGGSTDPEE